MKELREVADIKFKKQKHLYCPKCGYGTFKSVIDQCSYKKCLSCGTTDLKDFITKKISK